MGQRTVFRAVGQRRVSRLLLGVLALFAMLVAMALPASANGDFGISMVDNPSPVDRGSDITYVATIFKVSGNADHHLFPGETVTFFLPTNLTFVSVSAPSQFSCSTPAVGASGQVVCTLQTDLYLFVGPEQITLVANSTNAPDSIRSLNVILTNADDPDPGNNSFTTFTPVTDARTPTATTMFSSPQPTVFGQPVTFYANVSGASETPPTGLLVFFIDGTPGDPITLDSNGQAEFTISTLSVGNHNVCAYYLGDSQNLPSCGALDGGQEVLKGSTTTSLVSSVNPSLPGQVVTFTATVAVVAPAAGTPTGTVTFFIDGGPASGPIALAGNTASLTTNTNTFSDGNHQVTAVYSGDGSFDTSTSPPVNQFVGPAATSTALTSSANPNQAGQPVTFTATVSTPLGTPTGSVVFTLDGVDSEPVPVGAGGTAAITAADLDVGTHSVVATYSGDLAHTGSASPTLTQTVGINATTTSLVASPNPSLIGQPVTFTATVSSPGGTPTGTVTFTVDGVPAAPVALTGGAATFSTSTLGAGPHSIVATYSGDASFSTSSSPTLTQTVGQTATATALASSLNPSLSGQPVTFTATVSSTAGTPTGTVTFTVDGVAGAPVALTGGAATFSTSTLGAGAHSVVATYGGAATFAGSASSTLTQTVNLNATTTALVSSANPSQAGQAVTFTATVAAASGTPSGTVVFLDGGASLGTGTLAGGVATLQTAALATGTHSITAVYQGDPANDQSTSPALAQEVQAVAGTVILRVVSSGADGAYAFTSPAGPLNLSVVTASGAGQSAPISINAGAYAVTAADMRAGGVALIGIACSDADSIGDVATRTATINLAAGETVTCTFTSQDTLEQTTGLMSDFLATRADLIMSNQPDTDRRIDRLNGTGQDTGNPVAALAGYATALDSGAPVSVSTSLSALHRMTGTGDPSSAFDIWFKGTYASLDTDAGGGNFGLASFGADYLLNPNLLVGAIIQIDRMKLADPASRISGTGWMAGPYITARLSPNLYLDVVAAAGTSSNKISPFGTYEDDFDTTRFMAQATLKGQWKRDAWTFSPAIRFGYFNDASTAFTDSLGVVIPKVSANVGQLAFSPEISYRMETESGMVVIPRLKLEGIFDFVGGAAETGFGDVHGRVEAGVDFAMAGGARVGLAAAYDGIGSDDLTAFGGSLKLTVPLN